MIRYGENPIVAVIDERHVGKTVDEVLGVGAGVPFVKDVEASLKTEPDALLIYIDHAAEYTIWLREIVGLLGSVG